jgi:2-dehydropantoate 2-reductase
MRVVALGSGAIGGYCGAMLARAGHDVTFIARGAHLAAIRTDGLTIRTSLGAFTVKARAESDSARMAPVELVVVGVKTYDNAAALPMLRPIVTPATVVLSFQNGVDSPHELAAVIGKAAVLGGAAYVSTARIAPGVIEQTGTHRRFVFGEVFGCTNTVSERVIGLGQIFNGADMPSEPVADAWVPLWEKFIYLSTFAGFTGVSRMPVGALRSSPCARERFTKALQEVEQVARAEGVAVPYDVSARIMQYVDSIDAGTKSSLLFDLLRGSRLEVDALLGSVVRRAEARGLEVPTVSTLYAILKLYEMGFQKSMLDSFGA